MPGDIFYLVFIYPVETVIECAYLFAWRILKNSSAAAGFSIIGVSAAVSALLLPLYTLAEKAQDAERAIQKRLQPAINRIKAVFSGDEQYMILRTYYRQNHYHPLYALRTSLSVLIQAPFFIAAYHFLSHLETLQGVSFFLLRDLSVPDALMMIGGGGARINFLPIVMTLCNIASALVYSGDLPRKEKIPLFCLPALFLVLLYNAPSGLVLYWTCNNIFSLIKNVVQKSRLARKCFFAALALISVTTAGFVLFIHGGALYKRIIIAGAALLPWGIVLLRRFRAFPALRLQPAFISKAAAPVYALAAGSLALLAGFVLPSRIVASSTAEFSLPSLGLMPLSIVGVTFLEAAGFFAWFMLIFALCGAKRRPVLAALMSIVFCAALVNTYFFARDYGFMTPDLRLWGFRETPRSAIALNAAVLFMVCAVIVFIFLKKRETFLVPAFGVCIAVFVVLSGINVIKIMRNTASGNEEAAAPPQSEKVYTFSKTGKNVLVIMLDRAISGYVPYIFEEKPELAGSFTGWTYYPNCISFGPYTIYGVPAIFGGYEYTPLAIQKRAAETWFKKYYEALQVMPALLAENGFQVTVSDQPFMDNSLYDSYKNITPNNIKERYSYLYASEHPNIFVKDYNMILRKNFLRFSFFHFSPLALRTFVYDNGDYLAVNIPAGLLNTTLSTYSALYYLPGITDITNNAANYAAVMVNDLTHEPAFLQAPDYILDTAVTNRGAGPFADEDHYHVNMAAFLLLAKWFDYLKAQGVYDNTKIIIVSDHGRDIKSPFPGNITLPSGESLEAYTSLLMVKDFNADGALRSDSAFMTCADTLPLLARGLPIDAKNPFTGKPLAVQKENGVTITSAPRWEPQFQRKYRFDIKPDEWLHVHDNIFEPSNWSKVRVEE